MLRRSAPAIVRLGRLSALLLPALLLSGCINLVPVPIMGELEEAKALARTFRSQLPQVREQLQKERDVAQNLTITLEESAQLQPAVFRDKFNGYIDQLVAIRTKRREIEAVVRQQLWQSSFVYAVQQDALKDTGSELARTQSWIELAQEIRLRADLGRTKDFPEFATLSHELNTFLADTGEDPLGNQLRALFEEYRFGENEIGN